VAVNVAPCPEWRQYLENNLRRRFEEDAGVFDLNLSEAETLQPPTFGARKPLVELLARPARHPTLSRMVRIKSLKL
jgi:hypothetical protein